MHFDFLRKRSTWISLCRVTLGFTWLYASIFKVIDPDRFLAELTPYKIGNLALDGVASRTLPWAEFMLGIFTLCGTALMESFAAGAALLALYICIQAIAWRRGLSIDCGCGLGSGHDVIGWKTIGRTTALFALSFVGYILALSSHRAVKAPEPALSLQQV